MDQPGLIVELYDRFEQIISELCPAWSREATLWLDALGLTA
jgi:hypothetical protein